MLHNHITNKKNNFSGDVNYEANYPLFFCFISNGPRVEGSTLWFDNNFFKAKPLLTRVRTKISELVGYGLEIKRPVIGCGRRADSRVKDSIEPDALRA